MRISIRLYRNKDLDIMNFLYNTSKGRFDTSLVRDILRDYTNGRFEPYPVSSIEDPNSFPEMKLISVTINDDEDDIIAVLKSIQKGMGNIFIKCLIRKYSDISSLQVFRTGIAITKFTPTKDVRKAEKVSKKEEKEVKQELLTNNISVSTEDSASSTVSSVSNAANLESITTEELEANFNGDDEDDFWNDLSKMMQIF